MVQTRKSRLCILKGFLYLNGAFVLVGVHVYMYVYLYIYIYILFFNTIVL